jgi:hypothetical protein
MPSFLKLSRLGLAITKRRLILLLSGALAMGVVAAIIVGAVLDATLAFSVVAAVAAITSAGLAWRSGKEQRQMADDVRRLAELSESSLEEARAHKPEPAVGFLLRGGESAVSAKLERKREIREIDLDAIIAKERAAALATLPDRASRPKPGTGLGPLGLTIDEMAKISAQLGIPHISETDERVTFETRVEDYLTRLTAWIEEFERWRQELLECVHLQLCFENSGRVATYDARVDVHFPDPFEPVEVEPELSDPPVRPRFTRDSRFPWIPRSLVAPMESVRPAFPQPSRNVSRPKFREGSVHVDLTIAKLLHGVTERSDTIILRLREDGAYQIPWEIRAENLPEPARGELEFMVETVSQEGSKIETLDGLQELING